METEKTANILFDWYKINQRDLPWRKTRDAYLIWVSEIILQQTRIEQGTPYYLKFISRFPNVVDLANASIEDVLLVWQGLGYYSRARNMHFAANQVVNTFDSGFLLHSNI
jgi:A/G-specific adenine glycosylase